MLFLCYKAQSLQKQNDDKKMEKTENRIQELTCSLVSYNNAKPT